MKNNYIKNLDVKISKSNYTFRLYHFKLALVLLILFYSCSSPKAAFSFDKKSNLAPTKISFVNQSKNATDYTWSISDGTTYNSANCNHRFAHSGRYEVTLVAKKNNKTSASTSVVNIFPPLECLVEIQTTAGSMLVKLYDKTHEHRENFLKLAETGYYEGMLFHRVIKGFMIQTGDPESKDAQPEQRLGTGGPGYTIKAEFSDTLYHVKGAIAAARTGDQTNPMKSSSGSQFYIVQGRPVPAHILDEYEIQKKIKYSPNARQIMTRDGGAPQLDQEYTVFGQVIEGLETLDIIAGSKTDKFDRPINDIKILKINIIK